MNTLEETFSLTLRRHAERRGRPARIGIASNVATQRHHLIRHPATLPKRTAAASRSLGGVVVLGW